MFLCPSDLFGTGLSQEPAGVDRDIVARENFIAVRPIRETEFLFCHYFCDWERLMLRTFSKY